MRHFGIIVLCLSISILCCKFYDIGDQKSLWNDNTGRAQDVRDFFSSDVGKMNSDIVGMKFNNRANKGDIGKVQDSLNGVVGKSKGDDKKEKVDGNAVGGVAGKQDASPVADGQQKDGQQKDEQKGDEGQLASVGEQQKVNVEKIQDGNQGVEAREEGKQVLNSEGQNLNGAEQVEDGKQVEDGEVLKHNNSSVDSSGSGSSNGGSGGDVGSGTLLGSAEGSADVQSSKVVFGEQQNQVQEQIQHQTQSQNDLTADLKTTDLGTDALETNSLEKLSLSGAEDGSRKVLSVSTPEVTSNLGLKDNSISTESTDKDEHRDVKGVNLGSSLIDNRVTEGIVSGESLHPNLVSQSSMLDSNVVEQERKINVPTSSIPVAKENKPVVSLKETSASKVQDIEVKGGQVLTSKLSTSQIQSRKTQSSVKTQSGKTQSNVKSDSNFKSVDKSLGKSVSVSGNKIVDNVVDGIVHGIGDGVEAVINKADTLVTAAVQGAEAAIGVIHDAGTFVIDTLQNMGSSILVGIDPTSYVSNSGNGMYLGLTSSESQAFARLEGYLKSAIKVNGRAEDQSKLESGHKKLFDWLKKNDSNFSKRKELVRAIEGIYQFIRERSSYSFELRNWAENIIWDMKARNIIFDINIEDQLNNDEIDVLISNTLRSDKYRGTIVSLLFQALADTLYDSVGDNYKSESQMFEDLKDAFSDSSPKGENVRELKSVIESRTQIVN
ncbi:hypothetical protein [Borrelia crocidurae]|uniref:Immunogenic protein A n=1 Tax=Borrelia crocidurae (strain Achema) TaxID=1155096 RepID=I0FEB1_BORCA|nr:hypothetical protein [Borrelia crocidurae]AFI31817.1 hypothetical protein Q7M_1109 [Borrelia crocidurae str. Achema]